MGALDAMPQKRKGEGFQAPGNRVDKGYFYILQMETYLKELKMRLRFHRELEPADG